MRKVLLFLTILLAITACGEPFPQQLKKENLIAWCIVPFDNQNRTPQQRIEMLQRLGINRYAYDWRQKHLGEMAAEWQLAAQNGIDVTGVWMWINQDLDSLGRLSPANERILATLRQTKLNTQLWVSLADNLFTDLEAHQAFSKGVKIIDLLALRADSIGSTVGLYNHGGWFGNPYHQIKIIEALPQHDLGIIYNFHHAHHQIEQFPELVEAMIPHLSVVNLNGMKKNGPKILPIGQGNAEKTMITTLLEKGYQGPFGILGHVEDADVEVVLQENLNGLKALVGSGR